VAAGKSAPPRNAQLLFYRLFSSSAEYEAVGIRVPRFLQVPVSAVIIRVARDAELAERDVSSDVLGPLLSVHFCRSTSVGPKLS